MVSKWITTPIHPMYICRLWTTKNIEKTHKHRFQWGYCQLFWNSTYLQVFFRKNEFPDFHGCLGRFSARNSWFSTIFGTYFEDTIHQKPSVPIEGISISSIAGAFCSVDLLWGVMDQKFQVFSSGPLSYTDVYWDVQQVSSKWIISPFRLYKRPLFIGEIYANLPTS